MKRTRHFRFALGRSNHAARQDHLHFMRAQVLTGIPFPPVRKIEHGNLVVFILYTCSAVFRKVSFPCCSKPNGHRSGLHLYITCLFQSVGIFCSRISTKESVGSVSSLFTKCLKRERSSGFSTPSFHSHL